MEFANKQKEYKTSSHAKYSCQYHVIFCPKYRRKILVDGVDKRVKELFSQFQDELGYEVLDLEVMPDHVHALLNVPPTKNLSKLIGNIKGKIAHELRIEFPSLKSRLPSVWTRSYFISSVGAVTLEVVKRYIENQKTK